MTSPRDTTPALKGQWHGGCTPSLSLYEGRDGCLLAKDHAGAPAHDWTVDLLQACDGQDWSDLLPGAAQKAMAS